MGKYMKLQIESLSRMNKALLKQTILQKSDGPSRIKSYAYFNLNKSEYDSQEIYNAFNTLKNLGYFVQEGDVYTMQEDVFRYVKKYYSKHILFQKTAFLFKRIVSIKFIAGLISGIILVLIIQYIKNKFGH
jgi:hypothetical protein